MFGHLCRPRLCRGPGSRNDAFEGVEEQDEDPEGEPEGDQIDPGRERGAAQSRERAPKEADEGKEVEERGHAGRHGGSSLGDGRAPIPAARRDHGSKPPSGSAIPRQLDACDAAEPVRRLGWAVAPNTSHGWELSRRQATTLRRHGQALAQYRNVRVGLQSLSRRHTPSCLPADTGPTRRWYEPDKSRLCRGPGEKPPTMSLRPPGSERALACGGLVSRSRLDETGRAI